ncbi:MAG: acyltransferase [Hyphomonas sp.]|jgi:peptidoglycan/LPS O-acetylase OafA/YrhL|uniref:acyltransferase family protein n=1 Tax=Hyphomonas sp. TaxID=87 RepID=UPI0032637407
MTSQPIVPNPSTPEQVTFSNSLASLRGTAASFVVIYHAFLLFKVAGLDTPQRHELNFSDPFHMLVHGLIGFFNGPAAVVLFFVLSGTVLTLSLRRSKGKGILHLAGYYVRRLFRLYPLLIAVTLFAAAMHWFFFTDTPTAAATSWMNGYFNHDPGLPETVLNAVGYSNSLNSPAWTIRTEIIASFLMPLFVVLTRRPALIVATLAVLLALMYAPLHIGHVNVYLIAFFLGALIPAYGRSVANLYFRFPKWFRYLLIACALFAGMFVQRIFRPWIHVDPSSVLVVSLAASFLVTITYYGRNEGWLASKWLVFLGDISYGLYLLHFIILFAFADLIGPFLGANASPISALAMMTLIAALTLAVTIPLATLSYHYLERPLQDLGRKYSKQIQSAGKPADRPVSSTQTVAKTL